MEKWKEDIVWMKNVRLSLQSKYSTDNVQAIVKLLTNHSTTMVKILEKYTETLEKRDQCCQTEFVKKVLTITIDN